ncbi:MAG: leucine-rich repeat domain-containing protein, partial [Oscillospiraceae bacterium]|nr:leucine-rich repeat domain-containing protein [Oscillospiraceae bacterium]
MRKSKRWAAWIMAVLLLLSMLPGAALASAEADNSCGEGVTWSLNGGVLTISAAEGSAGVMNDFKLFGFDELAQTSDTDQPWAKYAGEITSVVVEEGVTHIGDFAFYGLTGFNDNGLNSVTLPEESLESIGNFAFFDAYMEEIDIPDSVTSIGAYAFYSTWLESVSISKYVTEIGEGAFACNAWLEEIIVDGQNENYQATGGVLFDKSGKTLLSFPGGYKTSTSYTVGPEVEAIAPQAFSGSSTLESLDLSESSVKSIGAYAFAWSEKLASVSLNDQVTEIGDFAFLSCKSLTNGGFSIPSALKEIKTGTFAYCDGLTNVAVPEGITAIGSAAFAYCDSLENITLPSTLTAIGAEAFRGCAALTEVTIPSSVTALPDAVFYGCQALESVEFPDTLTEIGDEAFAFCAALKELNLPGSVASIGEESFAYNIALDTVAIPNNAQLKSIGDGAFANCYHLFADGVKTLASSVTVGKDNEALTRARTVTTELAKGTDGDLTWLLESTGMLTVSGADIPKNFASQKLSAYMGDITALVIGTGVSGIGPAAFRDCANLAAAYIPNTVTEIDPSAFDGCAGLEAAGNVGMIVDEFAADSSTERSSAYAYAIAADTVYVVIPKAYDPKNTPQPDGIYYAWSSFPTAYHIAPASMRQDSERNVSYLLIGDPGENMVFDREYAFLYGYSTRVDNEPKRHLYLLAVSGDEAEFLHYELQVDIEEIDSTKITIQTETTGESVGSGTHIVAVNFNPTPGGGGDTPGGGGD